MASLRGERTCAVLCRRKKSQNDTPNVCVLLGRSRPASRTARGCRPARICDPRLHGSTTAGRPTPTRTGSESPCRQAKLRKEPRLGDAIITLPRLEGLEMTCVGARCVKLVRDLQKTPRNFHLVDILSSTDFPSVLEALAVHQDLEELALLYGMSPYIAPGAMHSLRWPSVKKVTARGIPTPLLEHAFQGAVRLHIF
ncbi:hypothetical protein DAEQUDRAFT_345451 [Daedalea quercina L-15889]|uniref:Uncharacterized protein n=1 Tax=Daedalea quercina L-15889 TaxID=1314783 RepID=A0A165PHH7_9APHY|nr:hypothetical protein DAEQUDRAFT_345451 [Daedalea quercina L-15889]